MKFTHHTHNCGVEPPVATAGSPLSVMRANVPMPASTASMSAAPWFIAD
ncbi:MAG: hypothetical protein ACJ72W_12065 [Actinoallomurus sp.]